MLKVAYSIMWANMDACIQLVCMCVCGIHYLQQQQKSFFLMLCFKMNNTYINRVIYHFTLFQASFTLMCVLKCFKILHWFICTVLRTRIIVVETLYQINYYCFPSYSVLNKYTFSQTPRTIENCNFTMQNSSLPPKNH